MSEHNKKEVTEPIVHPIAEEQSTNSQQTGVGEDEQAKEEEQKKVEERIDRIEKALQEQAQEGEKPQSSSLTFSKIIGGDILSAQVLRNNIGLIVLVVFFVIIYITNRYNAQKYLIEIDKLNTEVEDAKYRALSSSSQLTEKTRESHILELLKNNKDSVLKISDRPPYIINVPE